MRVIRAVIVHCVIGCLFAAPMPALALLPAEPVIDWTAIGRLIKNFNQLKKQYGVLQNTYADLHRQLEQVKQLKRDAEGHYGYGGLLNSGRDLTNRQWSPDSWQNTLKGLSGGNPARYHELVAAYQRDHPSLSSSDYQQGASVARGKVYSQDVQVNRAAMVNATYAFNTIKTHLNTIHSLSTTIDQTQNTKAATDLNSRLLAEVAYIQTQELKMQILINQQFAQANADAIADNTAAARFNRLPDE